MKKNILQSSVFLLICFCSLSSFAQLESFDLSDYELPNLNRKSLYTRFNLSSSSREGSFSNGSTDYISKNKDYSFYDNINIGFNHYLNNEKFQRNVRINGSINSRFNKNSDDTVSDSKSFNYSTDLRFRSVNRLYFANKIFLETDFDMDYFFYSYKSDETDYEYDNNIYYDGKSKNSSTNGFSFNIPIKTGWGRVEEVQDARHAIYILNELKKANRINKEQSKEEIIEFANYISELKNERFFDSRIRHMAEIEALDSFLVTKGYIDKNDARYFTTLNDFWTYGGLNKRESGSRLSLGIIPGYYIYNSNFERTSDIEAIYGNKRSTNAYSIDGGFEYTNEKPINLKWQNSLFAKAYVGVLNGNYIDTSNAEDYKFSSPNIRFSVSDNLKYYPNTRTNLAIGYSLNYNHLINNADSAANIAGSWGDVITSSLDFGFNYYISQKVRLYIYASLNYQWRNSQYATYSYNNASYVHIIGSQNDTSPAEYDYNYQDNYLTTNFSISLTYNIF